MPALPSPSAPVGVEVFEHLEEAWRPARQAGIVGPATVETLYCHARGFILEPWRDLGSASFVDCGCGAGVLGVLLALELPSTCWTLVDARERRCEFAEMAVKAAGLEDRVRVVHATVAALARRIDAREAHDGVVARLFGPASELAECGLPLVRVGSMLVVSVSEATRSEWLEMELRSATGGMVDNCWSTTYGHYLSVKKVASSPSGLPRRAAARRRRPLT